MVVVVNCRSSMRLPVEVSYITQVDYSQDDTDRILPHPSTFYGPPYDVVINSRSDDADDHGFRAAAGFLSMLSNYDVYVGIPDLKPSQAHRITRDQQSQGHPQQSRYSEVSPELP